MNYLHQKVISLTLNIKEMLTTDHIIEPLQPIEHIIDGFGIRIIIGMILIILGVIVFSLIFKTKK